MSRLLRTHIVYITYGRMESGKLSSILFEQDLQKPTIVKLLKIFKIITMVKMSRPLSAGGSGLELVGIKEPELPPVSFDVCCYFHVKFVLMSFFGQLKRNSQIILKLP